MFNLVSEQLIDELKKKIDGIKPSLETLIFDFSASEGIFKLAVGNYIKENLEKIRLRNSQDGMILNLNYIFDSENNKKTKGNKTVPICEFNNIRFDENGKYTITTIQIMLEIVGILPLRYNWTKIQEQFSCVVNKK